ncbi:MAG: hypothetical protein LBB53_06500 [Prevotellaceae bacterium]|jgi:hypothetical protein|nr:hypothetical protein [Prevotellaceae bacterium]
MLLFELSTQQYAAQNAVTCCGSSRSPPPPPNCLIINELRDFQLISLNNILHALTKAAVYYILFLTVFTLLKGVFFQLTISNKQQTIDMGLLRSCLARNDGGKSTKARKEKASETVIAKPAQHIKLLIKTKLMRVEAIAEWKQLIIKGNKHEIALLVPRSQ